MRIQCGEMKEKKWRIEDSMFRKKIIPALACIIGLVAAFITYHNFHPEDFMKTDEKEITLSDIEKSKAVSYVGHPAGKDIPRLQGKEEFEKIASVEDVTIETKKIIATGVGSRKAWESAFTSKGSKRGGGRRKADEQKGFDILDYYNEYYLIECPDETYILAQMPEKFVKKIQKGEKVTLPICRKNGLSQKARTYLTEICEKYDASMNGVLYAFDDEWYEEHSLTISIFRIGVSAVIFFVLSVVIMLLLEKIFKSDVADAG